MEAVMMPEKDKTEAVRVEYMETRYPSYMHYETTVGKKEKYNAILADFKEMREKLFDKKTGLVFDLYEEGKAAVLEEGEFKTVSAGYYLMGVIDTMSAIAQEIFEQYKAYEAMFKEAVKGVLAYYDEEEGVFCKFINKAGMQSSASEENPVDIEGTLMIAYALLKGCNMHALLTEKYFPIAKQLFVHAEEKGKEEGTEEIKRLIELAEEQYSQCLVAAGMK